MKNFQQFEIPIIFLSIDETGYTYRFTSIEKQTWQCHIIQYGNSNIHFKLHTNLYLPVIMEAWVKTKR